MDKEKERGRERRKIQTSNFFFFSPFLLCFSYYCTHAKKASHPPRSCNVRYTTLRTTASVQLVYTRVCRAGFPESRISGEVLSLPEKSKVDSARNLGSFPDFNEYFSTPEYPGIQSFENSTISSVVQSIPPPPPPPPPPPS